MCRRPNVSLNKDIDDYDYQDFTEPNDCDGYESELKLHLVVIKRSYLI